MSAGSRLMPPASNLKSSCCDSVAAASSRLLGLWYSKSYIAWFLHATLAYRQDDKHVSPDTRGASDPEFIVVLDLSRERNPIQDPL